MLVVFISAVRRKLLFGFRLFLLIIIMTVLATQIYAVFKPGPPPGVEDAATCNGGSETLMDRLTIKMKDYYRGHPR